MSDDFPRPISFSVAPLLQRGVRRGPLLTTFQPAGLGAAPRPERGRENGVSKECPALKHGASENTDKEFGAWLCGVYLVKTSMPPNAPGEWDSDNYLSVIAKGNT